ncbi:MAG: AAA family ATPase, partial [Candidatus Limnocylindria bacterium]
MRCPACGSDNAEEARFCGQCGSQVTIPCPACGALLTPGVKFCTSCGAAIPSATKEPVDQLPAERRRISVLFVDLENFTPIAEALDPEEVRAIQSRYFTSARSVIATYGGTLEKFIGDAVVAVWGAPVAHEDDPERAVRAALEVVSMVGRLGATPLGPALSARAAVATGEAAVSVGSDGQGMISGDVVNVAARMQSEAPAGGVLVSAETRQALGPAITLKPAGALRLKGKAGPVDAFLATGVRTESGGQASAHAGPFVGRDGELRELIGLFEAVVRDRRARLASVIGIAGIGKSRLAWEFYRHLDALPALVMWHTGRVPAYGDGLAFAAVGEMVRRRAHIEEGADPEHARHQLDATMRELVPDPDERGWMEPRVAALLDATPDREFEREELFAAWRRFFERVSDVAPAVLIFEDVQWADAGLLDFIEHLAEWGRDHPILVVSLARPEMVDRRPGWGVGLRSFTALRLDRLPDQAMRQLLDGRAPGLPSPAVRHILERAGGVPLYAVEVVRMLVDRGQLVRDDGRTRLTAPLERFDVPDSLHGILAARVDALPPADRSLLMAAAVLGPRFHPDALAAVARIAPSALRAQVNGLLRRELLTLDDERRSPGFGQLNFVQDLVRELAYRTISRTERRERHLSAARYLESLEDEEMIEAIAGHLAAAHETDPQHPEAPSIAGRARTVLRHAAARAQAMHAPDRALGNLERAIAMTVEPEERAALWEEAAAAARSAARFEIGERYLRELVAFRAAAGQRPESRRAQAQLASLLLMAHQNDRALAELQSAMLDTGPLAAEPAEAELMDQLARAKLLVGSDTEAIEWAERALVAAQGLDLPAIAADALVTRGTARVRAGDHDGGLADLRRAVEDAESDGLLTTELRARNNLAWLAVSDDPRLTLDTARQGLELATVMGLGDWAIQLTSVALSAAIKTGDWEWALATYRELEDRQIALAYRIDLAAVAGILHVLRGDRRPLGEIEGLEPFDADIDPQDLASVHHARAWHAFSEGRLADARLEAHAAAGASLGEERFNEQALATRAALWMADAHAVRAELERLAQLQMAGRDAEASLLTLRAGLSALERAPSADHAYGEAAQRWRDL